MFKVGTLPSGRILGLAFSVILPGHGRPLAMDTPYGLASFIGCSSIYTSIFEIESVNLNLHACIGPSDRERRLGGEVSWHSAYGLHSGTIDDKPWPAPMTKKEDWVPVGGRDGGGEAMQDGELKAKEC